MSDLDTLKAILDRAGVVYSMRDREPRWQEGEATALEVTPGDNPQNKGYGGFVSRLVFDDEGVLLCWEVWE